MNHCLLILLALVVFRSLALGDETKPSLISKTEPQYTDQARKDKISGNVLLSILVDENGLPKDIQVLSPLADGLDQKAVEAVTNWRFKPGTRDGVPTAMRAQVEVSFMLCSEDCAPNPDINRLERARAIYNLAIHQLRGDLNGKQDATAAFRDMQKAAVMGFGPAETALGRLYNAGLGTSVDKAQAAEWFDRAAFQGEPAGEYELGELYRLGSGVPRDPVFAAKLFSRAAEKDQKAAQFSLGLALETGDGVPQDLIQAAKWYRKSAEQGTPLAQYHLARLYSNGSAGKADQISGLMWAILAERNGVREAAAEVQKDRAAMTAGQAAEAEKRAARFKPRTASARK